MYKRVVSIASCASLSGLLFGYDTGIISAAILFIEKELSLKGVTGEKYRNSLINHSISSVNNLLTSS